MELGYLLYFLIAVGLSILLTAAFRRIQGDEQPVTPLEEDEAFNRRINAIEEEFNSLEQKPDFQDKSEEINS